MKKEGSLYRGHRFPGEIISHCVWLYFRFALSYRDVQELMAERGVVVSHEAIRHWCEKFGRVYARQLRQRRGRLGDTWHLDEVFVRIEGRQRYLWRAVDQEGNVLDVLVQAKRDKKAAARFFRKVLHRAGYAPRVVVTDGLASYREPCARLASGAMHVRNKGANNRAENSHQPTRNRERRMKGFKSVAQAQRFVSIFGMIYELFSVGRHLLKAEHSRLGTVKLSVMVV